MTINQSGVSKKKVLLIDDEPDSHEPFKTKLEQEGYEVLTANGGEEAWQKIVAEKPQVLILDIRMPGLNGEELLIKLRDTEVSPGTKIIIATGVSDYGHTKDRIMRNFNIVAYLEKPVALRDLVEKVNAALGKTNA